MQHSFLAIVISKVKKEEVFIKFVNTKKDLEEYLEVFIKSWKNIHLAVNPIIYYKKFIRIIG